MGWVSLLREMGMGVKGKRPDSTHSKLDIVEVTLGSLGNKLQAKEMIDLLFLKIDLSNKEFHDFRRMS